jgi:hypothetical protein
MPSPYFDNYGVITLDAATVTLTDEGYVGSRLILHRAAGVTATLPPATGSGNRYEFLVRTTVTSNGYIIRVANGSDTMVGTAILFADGGDTTVSFAASGTHDTITLSGTATGGIAGASVIVDDIAANLWCVRVVSDASGTEATPFSATVS